MALWSLHVEVSGKHYSTQIVAETPKAAMRVFFKGGSLASFLRIWKLASYPTTFASKDIWCLVPMDGLRNMYFCQIGKEGKYVSVTLVRTVSRQQS